jgi:hypothetical protein
MQSTWLSHRIQWRHDFGRKKWRCYLQQKWQSILRHMVSISIEKRSIGQTSIWYLSRLSILPMGRSKIQQLNITWHPEDYWLKAKQDPSGKSSGQLRVAIHLPTKYSPSPLAMAGFSFGTHHPEQRVESSKHSHLTNARRNPEHHCSTAEAVTCS